MKMILTAAFILISCIGFAQQNFELNKSRMQNKISGQRITSTPYVHKMPPKNYSLPVENKDSVVVELPQGGMPCIIPDMRKFNTMPNASKPADLAGMSKKPGAIPNPLFKPQSHKSKSLSKPNTNKEGS
jgi:hypothetical protein